MSTRLIAVALLFAFLASDADAQNRRHRRRGALLGGLAGAAIGAAIGDRGDNETAGALIGGAVGAIAGGTIGNQKDQRIEHNQRFHSGYHSINPRFDYPHPIVSPAVDPRYVDPHQIDPQFGHYGYHHVPPPYPAYRTPGGPPAAVPVTAADIIRMRHRGLSEATMLRVIGWNGVAARPSVSEVIDLHEHGVSERVIAAMQGDPVFDPQQSAPYPLHHVPGTSYRIPTSPNPTVNDPINGEPTIASLLNSH